MQRKVSGTWVGYLFFALVVLLLLALTGQYAYQHQWADFAGASVFTLIFVMVPTGGARWLRRRMRDRKSPKPPGERAAN